jgi:8-oxo-dGTP pyrophosphatase MutT (NUDIX family)
MSNEDAITMNAATVVCLRKKLSKWQVLLGQNEVKNWLRSSETSNVIMRYPGEWKFPGGAVEDADLSLRETAVRELQEEFIGIKVSSSSCVMHLLNCKITRPIQGKSFHMHNFVAFADENEDWLGVEGLEAIINKNLAAKKQTFDAVLSSGEFWLLSEEAKSAVSPEVHRVQWMDLGAAIAHMDGAEADPCSVLDDFQRSEFVRYGVRTRDPMHQSKVVLEDILALGTKEAIIAHSTACPEH